MIPADLTALNLFSFTFYRKQKTMNFSHVINLLNYKCTGDYFGSSGKCKLLDSELKSLKSCFPPSCFWKTAI